MPNVLMVAFNRATQEGSTPAPVAQVTSAPVKRKATAREIRARVRLANYARDRVSLANLITFLGPTASGTLVTTMLVRCVALAAEHILQLEREGEDTTAARSEYTYTYNTVRRALCPEVFTTMLGRIWEEHGLPGFSNDGRHEPVPVEDVSPGGNREPNRNRGRNGHS